MKNEIGVDAVNENDDLANDLGIDGDDYDEFISKYATKYRVDISSFLWYFHYSEEGSWNSIGGAFFKSPDKTVKHIPVSPLMLSEFAKKGKWEIQYPEHKLPKRRYDIIINQLLVLLFVILLLYKCVS